MNILYLCDEFPECKHGGIGSSTYNLAIEIAKKNHNVFVIGFYPYYRQAKINEVIHGVKVFRIYYGNYIQLQLSKRNFPINYFNIKSDFNRYTNFLNQFINDNSIDIIEMPDFNEAFYYSGKIQIEFPRFKVPMVVKSHGSYSYLQNITDRSHPIYRKENILYQNADHVIALSNHSSNRIQDLFSLKKQITVIHNGINLKDEIDKSTEYNRNKNVVFAGRFSINKGLISLLTAFKEVIRMVPDAQLHLYGREDDVKLNQISTYFEPEQLKQIVVHSFVDKNTLLAVYKECACAVFPSFMENFSMAPMEAMLQGCPTIYTKLVSGPELIEHNYNGILIDPNEPKEIADNIIKILTSKEFAKTLGDNGKKRIKDYFDISLIADQHIALYETLIKKFNK